VGAASAAATPAYGSSASAAQRLRSPSKHRRPDNAAGATAAKAPRWQCEFCDFKSGYDETLRHEAHCRKNPDAATPFGPRTRKR
jgi:hypothetical protein